MNDNNKTHFGYEIISRDDKPKRVDGVFHSVAKQYDIMNDLMSLGIHRIWKRFVLELSGLRPGHHVLDLAGGTGDLALKISPIVGNNGTVILADINNSMLTLGRDRVIDQGYAQNISFVQTNAEYLSFKDNSFDCVFIAFGLRNVCDQRTALQSMFSALKPNGRLLILEFSKPSNPIFSKLYDSYSFTVLPMLGRLVTGDVASYRYLAESIRMHPDQETLKSMMEDAGFVQCEYHNMTGGIVAVHRGIKP